MKQHKRHNFNQKTKITLAKRVGYICSYPNCQLPTTASSNESNQSINSIGVACHISAASSGKGARRYSPNLTQEERESIENGIWMCYNHSVIIDKDENIYTIEVLKEFKRIAEEISILRMSSSLSYSQAIELCDTSKIADFLNVTKFKLDEKENETLIRLLTIKNLLEENKHYHSNYGPESTNKYNDHFGRRSSEWKDIKRQIIIPNNDKIGSLIKNINFIKDSEFENQINLLFEHIKLFKEFKGDRKLIPKFPKQFESLLTAKIHDLCKE